MGVDPVRDATRNHDESVSQIVAVWPRRFKRSDDGHNASRS